MTETHVIGIDLAKSVFQLHGAAADGRVLFRRRLSRGRPGRFGAAQPPCVAAMEACASAHRRARRMAGLGHELRPIAPLYVKPVVRRRKTYAADAEAIVEAALRPEMRLDAARSAEARARHALPGPRAGGRDRDRGRGSRGHLAELGLVAPAGIGRVPRLAARVEDEGASRPSPPARPRGCTSGASRGSRPRSSA